MANQGFRFFFAQGLLKADLGVQDGLTMDGIGIPDLVVVTVQEENGQKKALIQVGDIKSSSSPGYHHKWQVAFYALLLEKILEEHGICATIAKTGFIITPGDKNPGNNKNRQKSRFCQDLFFAESGLFQTHEFLLKPYVAAFPVLIKTFGSILSCPPAMADHRLKPGCISCDWFYLCYHTALKNEDVQFLPGLTRGELLKLRQMKCKSITEICGILETSDDQNDLENAESDFNLEQKKKLKGQAASFLENKIFLKNKNTRLFPDNLSHAFFIHLIKAPFTGLPLALGYQVIGISGDLIDSYVWIMENHGDRTNTWQAFAARISLAWKKSFINGRVPHVFYFTARSQQELLDWAKAEQEEPAPETIYPKTIPRESSYQKPVFLWQTSSFTKKQPLVIPATNF